MPAAQDGPPGEVGEEARMITNVTTGSPPGSGIRVRREGKERLLPQNA